MYTAINGMCQLRSRVIVQQNKALIIKADTLAIYKKLLYVAYKFQVGQWAAVTEVLVSVT